MTIQEIMDAVKELKVLELAELVKALEEEFGVSAMPVAVAGGAAAGGEAAAAAEQTEFDVELTLLVLPRSTLSRLSVRSPASASRKLRQRLTRLPLLSRKPLPRKTQKRSRRSSKLLALPLPSSNFFPRRCICTPGFFNAIQGILN